MEGRIRCPACTREVTYQRFHAGFGNQGFMYGAASSVVLTWDTADPDYRKVLGDTHPWMLSPDQQHAVERAVRPGLDGEPFRFTNPPRCPNCGAPLQSLFDASREYFVVVGTRYDADAQSIWH